jgi:hypothetical protein
MRAPVEDPLAERLAVEIVGDGAGSVRQGPRNKDQGTRNSGIEGERAPVVRMREAEVYELLRDHDEGRLVPAPVALGEMPPDATGDMRRVAGHLGLLLGLRAAAGELRPLPYSSRWSARELGWGENRRRAQRAIRALCEAGVIECVGELPRRGQPYGTRLYAPPLHAVADERQAGDVGVEAVGPFEPVHEQGEHRGVRRAVGTERLDRDAASGNAAHGANANGREGDAP